MKWRFSLTGLVIIGAIIVGCAFISLFLLNLGHKLNTPIESFLDLSKSNWEICLPKYEEFPEVAQCKWENVQVPGLPKKRFFGPEFEGRLLELASALNVTFL
jgi:hypothetical protein